MKAKEALIETLKRGGEGGEGLSGDAELEARAELEELRSERDMLKEDLQQAQLAVYNLRTEIQAARTMTMMVMMITGWLEEVESSLAAEQRAGLESQRELQEAVQSAQLTSTHYQDQLHHLQKVPPLLS